MEKGLAELDLLPGVGGCFVVAGDGEVAANSTAAPLASATMQRLGRHVGHMLLVLGRAGRLIAWLDLRYDTWRLLVHDMGNGLLLIICESGADVALLKLSADVIVAGWASDAAVQKRLKVAPRAQLLSREAMDETARRLLQQGV
jgi:hypothetical protein